MRSLFLTVLAAIGLCLSACDFAPSVPESSVDGLGSAIRFGTVHWEGVETDCLDSAWSEDELGMGLVEGDTITLWFETMPELTGTLIPIAGTDRREAAVAGTMTFPGETGATVSCVVNGGASVDGAAVSGEMQERLTSDGDVNCLARGRYTMVFDD